MKSIAIVILNWNGKNLLEEFLPFVIEHSTNATIYVADNASTDDSVAFIQDHYPKVSIINNDKNYGYAGGYNTALKNIEEDIYVLLNSDIEVTKDWLNPVITMFNNDKKTAIIQPKILDYYKRDYFEYAGAAGGFIDKYGYPFCRGRIFDTIEKDNKQYNDTEIFWASGACLFIKKDVFRELGGFDEDFFAHQEEIDLCWRAFNNNYKIQFCSQSVVYHVGGATLKNSNPRKTFLNFRNSLWMLTKNLPSKQLFPVLFIRLVLDGVAGIKFIFNGQFSHLYAILKAHYCFYTKLSHFLKKRKAKQYKNYYKCSSIVYNYYLLKNKMFSHNFNNSL
ncbi:MAG: dTDP-Rha--alpha-D-GlcNAc-pyrophosphate polyprenol alpha-3-L-rhamnosyltransferase [Flavobacterium sp. MedPE-SWcel]|uniref:glycosyltransferase family 2 protein n=1 Tax=uncultured Flavobacterium sp. TaxID=165435 RepID=UPI00090F70AC|nr:glycosyltransferase family 2 protein [uncultured Flavobacterium sp.]OIQ18710.1 MAG: dTDP-Rha--alpha-D-GlcNAc-pyrophosphate polyprenol alpha-3-L-rhamnosyltransferase [Flavobacterium sp. MedPE-SWcel]